MNEKMMNVIATAATAASKQCVESFAKKMGHGEYINLHNNQVDHCDMIVMLLCGELVPIKFGVCQSMNPLRIDHDDKVYLSTYSLGANQFDSIHKELLDTYIEDYNIKQLEANPRYVIIGWHIF